MKKILKWKFSSTRLDVGTGVYTDLNTYGTSVRICSLILHSDIVLCGYHLTPEAIQKGLKDDTIHLLISNLMRISKFIRKLILNKSLINLDSTQLSDLDPYVDPEKHKIKGQLLTTLPTDRIRVRINCTRRGIIFLISPVYVDK